jgi:hypothetical protein
VSSRRGKKRPGRKDFQTLVRLNLGKRFPPSADRLDEQERKRMLVEQARRK